MRPAPVTIAAAAALLAACAAPASAGTHSWQVTDFSRLRVQGPFDVRVHVGQPSGVRATGSEAALERVSVEQHGDTLVIRPVRNGNWSFDRDDRVVIDVGTHGLGAASLAGSGNVAIDRVRGDALDLTVAGSGDLSVDAVDVQALKLAVTGSGDLTATGRAGTTSATLTGSGNLHGDKLQTDSATINLVGSGNLALGARRTAAVSLAGSGDVTVTGPASCTTSRSGSGNVRCARGGAG